ncbi:sigma-70 family RNA polymerase sigma factor (plasmid) [Saccharothrix sp. AJ9571]|nr:sigma-70 family RNA polymerase sigma factor [Saccharothrix sp. AJ9571]
MEGGRTRCLAWRLAQAGRRSPMASALAIRVDHRGNLIRRFAAAGDELAFAEMRALTLPAVMTVLHKRMPARSRMEIEDAVQYAYIELSQAAQTLHDPGQVLSWLITVARRYLAKAAEHTQWEVLLDPIDQSDALATVPAPAASDPGALVNRAALLEYLRRGLSEADWRVVGLLAEEYSSSEVIKSLQVKSSRVEGVRDRVSRLLRGTAWEHYSPPPRMIIADPHQSVIEESMIENAIQRLPDRQREVLNYNVYSGMQPKQIAQQLGVTPNTARVNLCHARQSLAVRLGLSTKAVVNLLDKLSTVVQEQPLQHGADEMIAAVFDVARFARRSPRDQEDARCRLRALVDVVLPEQALTTWTGDSLMTFVPVQAWRPGFAAALALRIHRHLIEDNVRCADQLQLRVLLDVDMVNVKAKAFSSRLAIDLLRISESDTVRASTTSSSGPLAVFVSERLHNSMMRGGHALPPEWHFTTPLHIVLGPNRTRRAWQLMPR